MDKRRVTNKYFFPIFLLILALAGGCTSPLPGAAVSGEPAASVEPGVLVGAGDITLPNDNGDDDTAALLDQVIARYPAAQVFTLGDNTQAKGSPEEFTGYFNDTWGRHLSRMHPIPGNHDYGTDGGAPYYDYFGAVAGEAGKGYYSYDVGAWHIVALNSNCDIIDCGPQSQQVRWLREDLETSRKNGQRCSLLTWHHPFWSVDGRNGDSAALEFWKLANQYRADVVLNGHDHVYERFAPQNVKRKPSRSGVQVFVVGTGGAGHHELGIRQPNSQVVDNTTYGVIQFLLYPDRYEWEFIPVPGGAFKDSGSGKCH